MQKTLTAAAAALMLGAAPMNAQAQEVVIVDTGRVVAELASHLRVSPNDVPPSVNLSDKLAAVVCEATLKQLREGGGRCVAVAMSQGLIQAVRQAMREG
jgi:hypothetical protein